MPLHDIDKLEIPETRNLVKVNNSSQDYRYRMPHSSFTQAMHSGCGSVITFDGKNYILTNAHVAQNSKHITVKPDDSSKMYNAKVINIDNGVDLALLEVSDPEFWTHVTPLEVGDMLKLKDRINVIGYPIDGEEVCISDGKITRIDFVEFYQSGRYLLGYQTDASVNPGNSGGPVKSKDNKLIGIATQGDIIANQISFIIPPCTIRHFLIDSVRPGPYGGFPELHFRCQEIINPYFKEALNIPKDHGGLLVTQVDDLSPAFGKLLPGDIVYQVEGLDVNSNGKINIPGVGTNIDWRHLQHSKFIGENIKITISRKNSITNTYEKVDLSIPMKYIPGETRLLGKTEFSKPPTFFIHNALLFTKLTPNLLEEIGHSTGLMYTGYPGRGLLKDIPKKYPDEEVVILLEVFSCRETKNYDDLENSIVDTINGIKVKNMLHAYSICMESKEKIKVKFIDGYFAIVDNISPLRHAEILSKAHVDPENLASDDLVTQYAIQGIKVSDLDYDDSKPDKSLLRSKVAPAPSNDLSIFLKQDPALYAPVKPTSVVQTDIASYLNPKKISFLDELNDMDPNLASNPSSPVLFKHKSKKSLSFDLMNENSSDEIDEDYNPEKDSASDNADDIDDCDSNSSLSGDSNEYARESKTQLVTHNKTGRGATFLNMLDQIEENCLPKKKRRRVIESDTDESVEEQPESKRFKR